MTRCCGSDVSPKPRPAPRPAGANGSRRWRATGASRCSGRRRRLYGFRPSGSLNSAPFGLRRGSSREIAPPAEQAGETWPADQALVEILRGRLEGLGPVTPIALAAPLGLEPGAIAAALAALESEGAILKGRFLPGLNDEQWCDRRLLARIHHSTVRRLRSEIEPVAARDFLRFLFSWAHVAEETRLEGPDALPVILSALEGFEAPAKAWETEILPARLKGYQASWLDAQCLAGRTSWARLTPPAAANGNGRTRHMAPVGATPIALIERRRAPLWMALAPLSGARP